MGAVKAYIAVLSSGLERVTCIEREATPVEAKYIYFGQFDGGIWSDLSFYLC